VLLRVEEAPHQDSKTGTRVLSHLKRSCLNALYDNKCQREMPEQWSVQTSSGKRGDMFSEAAATGLARPNEFEHVA
jgi:hypothetical protein